MNNTDDTPETGATRVAKWGLFFALAYAVQGFAQTTGILLQPIQYFYKEAHDYSASQLAGMMFWITFPWYIKPVYGLLADFIPLLGYRRKSYLILSAIIALGAFTLLLGIRDPIVLMYALTLTALCTAIGDVMVDALMVENGQRLGKIRKFQSIQWIAVSVLGMLAAIGGGRITEYAKSIDEPFRAVQIGAVIALAGPVLLLVATLWIVREKRSTLNSDGLGQTGRGLREAVSSKPLWGVLVFIVLFWFQPGISATMYLHATETLQISEQAWGDSDAFAKGGYLVGALAFMLLLGPRLSTRQLAALSVLLYAGITFGYLLLTDKTSLFILASVYGVFYMISQLTLMSLAAEVCPRRVEGFVFAFLMGLINFVRLGSDWVGGKIYDELVPVYDGTVTEGFWTAMDGMQYPVDPLIIISGGITLIALAALPLLPCREKSADPPIEAV